MDGGDKVILEPSQMKSSRDISRGLPMLEDDGWTEDRALHVRYETFVFSLVLVDMICPIARDRRTISALPRLVSLAIFPAF